MFEPFPTWSRYWRFYPIPAMTYEEMHASLVAGYEIMQMQLGHGNVQWFRRDRS